MHDGPGHSWEVERRDGTWPVRSGVLPKKSSFGPEPHQQAEADDSPHLALQSEMLKALNEARCNGTAARDCDPMLLTGQDRVSTFVERC